VWYKEELGTTWTVSFQLQSTVLLLLYTVAINISLLKVFLINTMCNIVNIMCNITFQYNWQLFYSCELIFLRNVSLLIYCYSIRRIHFTFITCPGVSGERGGELGQQSQGVRVPQLQPHAGLPEPLRRELRLPAVAGGARVLRRARLLPGVPAAERHPPGRLVGGGGGGANHSTPRLVSLVSTTMGVEFSNVPTNIQRVPSNNLVHKRLKDLVLY